MKSVLFVLVCAFAALYVTAGLAGLLAGLVINHDDVEL